MTSPANATQSTPGNLLDAAEALFAEHGFAGASMRAITARADANVAAAHYHFGSKEALLRAVIARRLGPINRARIERLDMLEAASQPVPLASLVRAFVAPVVTAGRGLPDGGRAFMQLIGRVMTGHDELLRGILHDELAEVISRFGPAFARSLPALDQAEMIWRLHFTVGAMAHAVGAHDMLASLLEDPAELDDIDRLVDRLVCFLVGGLAAPAASRGEKAAS